MEKDNTILRGLRYGYFKKYTEETGSYIYIGYAAEFTNDDEEKWFIHRIEIIGDMVTEKHTSPFVRWSDRYTATYI
jgi:hypothetical protein